MSQVKKGRKWNKDKYSRKCHSTIYGDCQDQSLKKMKLSAYFGNCSDECTVVKVSIRHQQSPQVRTE